MSNSEWKKRATMSYFPAFLRLEEKKVLMVGGGLVAMKKLRHLLEFTSDVFLIAPHFSEDIYALIQEKNLRFEQRGYAQGDIKGFDIVVVATDDIALQSEIYKESRQYRCLCNAVDSLAYCDFTFASYIKKEDLTIAVSTSGASPAIAKELKEYLAKLLPPDIGSFLQEMKELRRQLPKGKQRMKMLRIKAKNYFKKWSQK